MTFNDLIAEMECIDQAYGRGGGYVSRDVRDRMSDLMEIARRDYREEWEAFEQANAGKFVKKWVGNYMDRLPGIVTHSEAAAFYLPKLLLSAEARGFTQKELEADPDIGDLSEYLALAYQRLIDGDVRAFR